MADETGNPFVVVTNQQVYDVVVELRDNVRDLNVRMTNLLGETVDLRKRTRGLELKFYGILAGLIAVVGANLAGLGGH